MDLAHEWPVILDGVSRLVEAVAVIIAALYARHGARLAKRTAQRLGTLPLPWRLRRKRPGRQEEDPHLDQLRLEKDDALAAYLLIAKRLDDYVERPREKRH